MTDRHVENVVRKQRHRSQVGLKKYNVNLERTDLDTRDWLVHAQEEAMDLANYLEVLITRIDEAKAYELHASYKTHLSREEWDAKVAALAREGSLWSWLGYLGTMFVVVLAAVGMADLAGKFMSAMGY